MSTKTAEQYWPIWLKENYSFYQNTNELSEIAIKFADDFLASLSRAGSSVSGKEKG